MCISTILSRVTFRVYYRTCVSVYATTSGSHSSLTVSKLGHGVFVALFSKPVIAHKAIVLVEEFTNKLRY
uniref:Uncharacterized protein n=1 Tax=Arion vulgaris TaxID=1028688 RepID=A0A0B7A1T5_9EUPU